jgi:hypothetical protein
MDELLRLEKKWRNWKYQNTVLLVLSLFLFIIFADTPFVKNIIAMIGDFGYLGAFIAGLLFVSVFTIAPASVVLFYIAESLNPLGVAIAAGAGGVLGDYLIFKYLKDRVFDELKPIYAQYGGKTLKKIFKTPYFAWIVPIIGAAIIASPLPDEVGLGLLGLSKIKVRDFVLLTFLLNTVGIFLVIIIARSI